MSDRPVFDAAVEATLTACLAVCAQRGGEYLDSWHVDNQRSVFTDATLARLDGVPMGREEKRMLILAAMIDVKLSRMAGPWKPDTCEDLINYVAAYKALRQEYEERNRLP